MNAIQPSPKHPTHLVVVPDGISRDEDNDSLLKPSFVYRQVLDYAVSIARDGDFLYLAPANCFCDKSEHGLAYDYVMQSTNKRIHIYCPPISYAHYVDTYENARLLKQLLGDSFTGKPCELVCARLHSYRAAYCFRKTGFIISKVHRVRYITMKEKILTRWWYYRYKPIHYIYEMLALCRDICRATK